MRYEILVDRTERPQKCTILPLGYRTDFRIVRFDRRSPIASLTGSLLLHPDGAPLRRSTAEGLTRPGPIVLSAVDCNWLRLPAVMGRIVGPLPELVRIADGFQTSYLRRNKRNLDPDNGLATIEALFIAAAFLGEWDESLLREYAMGAEFLRVNAPLFERHGLGPAPVDVAGGPHAVAAASDGRAASEGRAASRTRPALPGKGGARKAR